LNTFNKLTHLLILYYIKYNTFLILILLLCVNIRVISYATRVNKDPERIMGYNSIIAYRHVVFVQNFAGHSRLISATENTRGN